MHHIRLSDLIDLTAVQKMADAHYQAAGMPLGIIDATDGSILVGVGWQDICLKFHRANPESRKRCQISDNYIKDHLVEGQYCHYKCQNGLWDIGIPIFVAERHLATMFLGQFFYEGEIPDRGFFVRQAREFGFDLHDYLAALDRVRVFKRETVAYILEYNKALVAFITDLAEQSLSKRKADAAFLSQQYYLQKAQEIGKIGTWELDVAKNELVGTDEAYKIIGFPVGEKLTYEIFLNCVYPDDREHVQKELKASLKGKPYDIEHRVLVDGDVKWVREKAQLEFNEKNFCIRATGVIQDITEHKRVEQALRASEERLSEAQRIANIGDWSWDIPSGRVEWSDQVYEIFKAPRRDPSFEFSKSFVHPADLDFWQRTVDRAVEKQEPFILEYRAIRLDGKTIWVHLVTKAVFNEKGEFAGFQGIVQDISERKFTEEALKESRERLRLALTGSGVSFWEWFPESGHIEFDERWVKTLGFQPGETGFDFKWWSKSIHPDSKPLFEKALNDYLEGRSPRYELEYRICSKTGEWKWIWAAGECVEWDKDQKPVHFLGTHFDITQRKEAEGKIRKLNATLEQRVAERTAELENRTQQLQQLALELSDAEDRERRRIAAILHDDFQQQLAYIKIELGILGKTADKNVGKALERLEALIGECIEKSRNLSHEITPPALHRSGLLAALAVLARDMKERHGLAVKLRTQSGAEPASLTLAAILYRSARELLVNVVKHAGVDTAVVDVLSKDGMIQIRVEDAGKGFDYQAVRATQDRGSGFGLYTIEDRMSFLGGSMEVETLPGKGCHVVLTVPQDVSPKAAGTAPPPEETVNAELMQAAPAAPVQPVDDSGHIRILLADDHQMMREALAKLLQGYIGLAIVGQAVNGREVIQLAAELTPHVILMDVSMPELDGFEATAHISRLQPDIRIIGLSMHNDAHTRQKMLDAGASAYLTKTGSPDTLVETIRRLHSAGN